MNVKLLEDKVAKFGGSVFPKFGWCCILAGGPGSGKGYSFEHYIPIEGHKFDVDEIKNYYVNNIKVIQTDLGDNLLVYTSGGIKHTIDLDKEGIDPPYNTTNTQFTGLLHQITKPLTKKLKDLIFKGVGNVTRDRLPNIIFDCTMSDISDYELLISNMTKLGYKIAIVYIMTPIDRAIDQNISRGSKVYTDEKGVTHYGRKVDYKLLLDNHASVYNSLDKVGYRPDLISAVDDIWVILNNKSEKSYPDVISIKNGDKLDLTKVKDFITNNLNNIMNKQWDYTSNSQNYDEGLVIGARELYKKLQEDK